VGGRIQARRLEYNIVEHCNLACRSCSHLSPIQAKHHVDADVLERDLTLLSRHYHAQTVRLLGGEPLLHPGLIDIIRRVRRSQVADVICIVTNGVLLPRMGPEFWESVDVVDVSVYPARPLTAQERSECGQRARAAGAKLKFSRHEEFRESYSEQGTSDVRVIRAIYDSCQVVHDWRCHTLADGRLFKCPQSYFLPKVVAGCAGNAGVDSVVISDSDDLGRKLLAFLEAPDPLHSCGTCLGTAGRRFAHDQVRRPDFRKLQEKSPEELLDPKLLRRAGRSA
jgi:organic radical activating enzyme